MKSLVALSLVVVAASYISWRRAQVTISAIQSKRAHAHGSELRPAADEIVKAEVQAASPSKPSPVSQRKSFLDEPALMATLRRLESKDASISLRLAREGNARFPDGADAAERAWIVVKSLDTLRRFHEGRDEAELMVSRYPGTSWALDVERHTLIYPLDQPSREEMQAADPVAH
ncbi:MAG TPA: hypothetical protein VH062_10770 [Polyangiaceae bacterium]|nr:hypothetical protein [Polyangiaceae bacterium]